MYQLLEVRPTIRLYSRLIGAILQESRMVAEQAAAVGWAAHYEAAGHPVHFHRLLDHQVANEALPRRSKVRILAETKTN